MAAYYWVYDSTSPAGWLPRTDISSEPYAQQLSMGYICLFYLYHHMLVWIFSSSRNAARQWFGHCSRWWRLPTQIYRTTHTTLCLHRGSPSSYYDCYRTIHLQVFWHHKHFCWATACGLRGVMCPWFNFWFWHYIYIVHLFVSYAFPLILFSSLFPYCSPPLLIFSLENKRWLNLPFCFFCVYFVLWYISFDWWMHAFVVLSLVFS